MRCTYKGQQRRVKVPGKEIFMFIKKTAFSGKTARKAVLSAKEENK